MAADTALADNAEYTGPTDAHQFLGLLIPTQKKSGGGEIAVY